MKRVGIGLIRVYRVTLSPFFRGSCRFEPSCSVYTEQAIAQVRPRPRQPHGRPAHRPLPSLEPGGLRPGPMSRSAPSSPRPAPRAHRPDGRARHRGHRVQPASSARSLAQDPTAPHRRRPRHAPDGGPAMATPVRDDPAAATGPAATGSPAATQPGRIAAPASPAAAGTPARIRRPRRRQLRLRGATGPRTPARRARPPSRASRPDPSASPTPAPNLCPGSARRRPRQPPGLGLHADLPGPLPGPRVPLQRHGRHRHRDHPAHDHHPHPAHPGLPGADRVAAADADAPAGAARDPDQVQGQPRARSPRSR